MREIIIRCDRCKKKITKNPIGIFLYYIDRETREIIEPSQKNDGEICEECAKKLMIEFSGETPLKKKPKTKTKENLKIKPVEEDPEIIRITGAQIEAFRKSGHSYDWISDEAQVTVATIKKIHKEYREDLKAKMEGA